MIVLTERTSGGVLGKLAGRVKETAGSFTGNRELARHIGLTPAAQVPLYNGKIPCRLLRFEPT